MTYQNICIAYKLNFDIFFSRQADTYFISVVNTIPKNFLIFEYFVFIEFVNGEIAIRFFYS